MNMNRIITIVATRPTIVGLRRSLIDLNDVKPSEIEDWNAVGALLDAPFNPWHADEGLSAVTAIFDEKAGRLLTSRLLSIRRIEPVKHELLLLDPTTGREVGRLGEGVTAEDVTRLVDRAPKLSEFEWGEEGEVGDGRTGMVGAAPPIKEAAPPESTTGPTGSACLPEPGVLTANGAESSAAPQPSPVTPLPTPPQSYVNVTVWDRDNQRVGEQLRVDEMYMLAFAIDVQIDSNATANALVRYPWAEDEQEVTLTVQLTSDDFDIYTEPQALHFRREGKSRNTAQFRVRPSRVGVGVLTAILLKDGNFIQLLTIKFRIATDKDSPVTRADIAAAPPAETQIRTDVMGRDLGSAGPILPRDVNLTILEPDGRGDFTLTLAGSVFASAKLPLTVEQLDRLGEDARAALVATVNLLYGPDRSKVYQTRIDIPTDARGIALEKLADAGWMLFEHLFYSPDADLQCRRMGDTLREIARSRETHKFQICSKHFTIPWELLYVGDPPDPDHPEQIDPELFLGLRHIIELIPYQPDLTQVDDREIKSDPLLTVGLNVEDEIDVQMHSPLVAQQVLYWNQIGRLGSANVEVRRTRKEIRDSISSGMATDQIAYFYCHAKAHSLSDGEGPDASCLLFNGRQRLTLRDLYSALPQGHRLSGSPLLFFNACESAQLSPRFYDGFVPFLISRGARGAIGTQCVTPALFAREWATRFFDHFLAGEPVGQVLLNLRREFYFQHNNLLGLLYALYCDADTRIDPALQLPSGVPIPTQEEETHV